MQVSVRLPWMAQASIILVSGLGLYMNFLHCFGSSDTLKRKKCPVENNEGPDADGMRQFHSETGAVKT